MIFKSVYPYTLETVEEHPLMEDAEIDRCLLQADTAFKNWKSSSFSQRAIILKNAAALLLREKEEIAALITREMGKTITEARAEAEKCALVCDYYAEHAEQLLKDVSHEAGYHQSFVCYEPIGAVLGIMPWNFPFWQVFRYAAPGLMAGNVTLLKHAPNVCGCAKKIESLFLEAGAPKGVFQTLIIDIPSVEKILQHNLVQGVTLTGSEKAGSSVAAIAGSQIKKSVLELGGSDALIVLDDADIQLAAATAMQSRMQNAGQSCIGAKRFIVLRKVADDFTETFTTLAKKLKQGDPFDPGTNMGPMARIDLAENLLRQLQQSVKMGASLIAGGKMAQCNFEPSILSAVKNNMPAFEEETFGPLAAITIADSEADAISMANNSRYGLGASIWTKDIDKGIALARQIESGSVFINALVKSDPRLPFGGIKKSGFGRELSKEGILEFVNTKTIAASL